MRYGTLFAATAALAVFLILAAAPPASASVDSAGNVIAARRQAWAERGRLQDTLASKSPVFTGDVLSTNDVGRLQVLFRDDSVLMLAPATRATVSEYVYEGGQKPVFGLKLARGVTRIISGRMSVEDPEAMTVETDQVIVGIRGTEVQITASADATEVLLLRGSAKSLYIYSKVHNREVPLTESGSAVVIRNGTTSMPRATRADSSRIVDIVIPIDQMLASGPSGVGALPEQQSRPDQQTRPDQMAQLDQQGRPPSLIDNTVLDTASDQSISRPDLPPEIINPEPVSFSGRYDGALAGSLAGAQVAGTFSVGIEDIAANPWVSGVSLYASGGGEAVSLYGRGQIAQLDENGNFVFSDTARDSKLRFTGTSLLPAGYVTASGNTTGKYLALMLQGSLDGETDGISLTGGGNKNDGNPADLPLPPAISVPFTGTYAGSLAGTIGGTGVGGNFTMGVAGLANSPYVSGISLYASALGRSAVQAMSIYGEGNLGAIAANGTFLFRADAASVARLVANNMLPDGYVIVSGSLDGSYVVLALRGNLEGEYTAPQGVMANLDSGLVVGIDGEGEKISAQPPGPGGLPQPPTISPDFAGRYSGSLNGSLGGNPVTGSFYMGMRDLTDAPAITGVSMFASEIGWADGATNAISIYGDGGGTVAKLSGNGNFSFRAGNGGAVSMDATNKTDGGYVTVSGIVNAGAANFGINGLVDGASTAANISGSGSKVSNDVPTLASLPTPPGIIHPQPPALSFAGTYSGSLNGTLGDTLASGAFHMGISNLTEVPTVNAVSIFASEIGWQENATNALSIYGGGNLARLDGSGSFAFAVGDEGVLPMEGHNVLAGGKATVSGITDGSGINLGIAGLLDGEGLAVNLNGGGGKITDTVPGLADLPVPPAIAGPSFAGRYSGSLLGYISETPVSGAFNLGLANLTETPVVTAASIFASDIGWQENATRAISIYSDGGQELANVSGNGSFSFLAGDGGVLPLYAHDNGNGLGGGAVTVSGITDGNNINLGISGLVDGELVSANINGSGNKTSDTVPPSSWGLPVPPAISFPVTGTYAGSLQSTLGHDGSFNISITDISSNTPAVTSASFFIEGGGLDFPLDVASNSNALSALVDSSGAFNASLNQGTGTAFHESEAPISAWNFNFSGVTDGANMNFDWDTNALFGDTLFGTGTGSK